MAGGFKKSLFGFNCSDVMEYIERSQKTFTSKENELTEQIKKLSDELELSNENYLKLNAEKNEIAEKLADFSEKYEEIERLSENIGKLYLVAQANARAIMENSEKSAAKAMEEVNKNLSLINDTHESLDELKKNIIKTSDDFVAEVDGLIASLNNTKAEVEANAALEKQAKEQFEEVYGSLVK